MRKLYRACLAQLNFNFISKTVFLGFMSDFLDEAEQ